MALRPREALSHYRIVRKIGQGGMGEVYLAEDTKLERRVALKVLPAEVAADSVRLARFEREAKALAALNHPNIVTIHSVEEAGGLHFLTMELVEGESLDRLVPPHGAPLAVAFDVGIALADALAAAHEKRIIHRDLKPSNVMVTKDGRVKVLDFGLAKLAVQPGPGITLEAESPEMATRERSLTDTGVVTGTVPYMSPEQVQGKTVDARTDIFSLGVVLYEMATGRRPFGGESPAGTLSSILRDTPRPVTEARHEAPRHLARIIDHCLQKEPRDRFQTARDVFNELRALRREAETADSRQPTTSPEASIAVLPFVNMSPTEDQEYFSDGVTEELINVLVKVPDLKVAGRTSSFSFKGKHEDLRAIGEKLGVAHILEGSVRKAGNKIRVTAQLVKAGDGFHLWSDTYDRTLDDIFAVQDDIARSVARELRVVLFSKSTDEPKLDAAAYDLVLQARFVLQNQTPEALRRGRQILDRALAIAPDYALVWAEKGVVHAREIEMATTAEERLRATEQAQQVLRRALELDPDLAVAHSRAAIVYAFIWEFVAAERSAERALAANPREIVMNNVAVTYKLLGRQDEAIALEQKRLEVDPLSPFGYGNLATSYVAAGRLDEADALVRKLLQLQPNDASAHQILGEIHLLRGEVREARAAYARFEELSGRADHWRRYYDAIVGHTAGNTAASAMAASEFEAQFGAHDPLGCAKIRAWRGESDAAFAWLDKALAVRDPYLAMIKFDVYLRHLHADPRWNALLRKIGLPAD